MIENSEQTAPSDMLSEGAVVDGNGTYSMFATFVYCYFLYTLMGVFFIIFYSPSSAYLQFNLTGANIWGVFKQIAFQVVPLSILSLAIVHFKPSRILITFVSILTLFILWPVFLGAPLADLPDYWFFGLLPSLKQISLVVISVSIIALGLRWIWNSRMLLHKLLLLATPLVVVILTGAILSVRTLSVASADNCSGSIEKIRECRIYVAQKTKNLDLCVQSADTSFSGGLSAWQILKASSFGSSYLSCVNDVWSSVSHGLIVDCGNQFSDVRARDICVYKNASSEKNAVMCNQVTDAKLKDSCLNELSSVGSVSTVSCSGIENIALGQKCFTDAGVRLKDISFCKQAPFPKDHPNFQQSVINSCISEVAIKNKDVTLCNEIETTPSKIVSEWETEVKQSCLASVQNNPEPCTLILREEGKSMCKDKAARENGNLKICDTSADKWRCYMDVAATKKDYSICQLILDNSYKSSCETSFRYPALPALNF